jgi:uncharacterized protein YcbK (DUF882 family)
MGVAHGRFRGDTPRVRRIPPANTLVNASRRSLLGAALAVPAIWVAGTGRSWADDLPANRELSLLNTHTGEALRTRYFEAGAYVPAALAQLQHLLRDHRSGDAHPIDPQLFDVLVHAASRNSREPHFEVISGYRSPTSNATLRSRSKGVAEHSLHMDGKAIDVRLAGVACSRLRDVALSMACGGVGYYARSDFVHLDTGRVRAWAG